MSGWMSESIFAWFCKSGWMSGSIIAWFCMSEWRLDIHFYMVLHARRDAGHPYLHGFARPNGYCTSRFASPNGCSTSRFAGVCTSEWMLDIQICLVLYKKYWHINISARHGCSEPPSRAHKTGYTVYSPCCDLYYYNLVLHYIIPHHTEKVSVPARYPNLFRNRKSLITTNNRKRNSAS